MAVLPPAPSRTVALTTGLDARFLPDLTWCLIGDRGYDSDGLDDLF